MINVKTFMRILFQALRGKKSLTKIIKESKINLKYDWIIFLSNKNSQLNYYTLLYINHLIRDIEIYNKNLLIKPNHKEKYYIVSTDKQYEAISKKICRRVIFHYANQSDFADMLRYYETVQLSNHIIMALFEELSSRCSIMSLVDNGFSIEEIVANGIFDFKIEYFNYKTRPKIPAEIKRDTFISKFIRENDLRLKNEKYKENN